MLNEDTLRPKHTHWKAFIQKQDNWTDQILFFPFICWSRLPSSGLTANYICLWPHQK